jgi:hypothetical protein
MKMTLKSQPARSGQDTENTLRSSALDIFDARNIREEENGLASVFRAADRYA